MKKLALLIALMPFCVQAYNAGILPYAKKDGQILFLLGKEARGRHKGQWADVGGKGRVGESKKETSIREFTEETGAAFAQFMSKKITKDNAEQLSNDYIESRIIEGITNPGPKKFYTMFLANVDYIEPTKILNNPYGLSDYEKNNFAWVNAKDLLNTLLRNNRYLEDYYSGNKAHYNPSFGDKQIRRPFATFFADPITNQIINEIIKKEAKGSPKSAFSYSETEHQINAGILPYAFHDGKYYFLLYKNMAGPYKNQWSAFDGALEEGITPEEAAIKNFNEITGGFLGQFLGKSTIDTAFELSSAYITARINEPITNPGPERYILYLAKIDYFALSQLKQNSLGLQKGSGEFMWVEAAPFMHHLVRANYFYRDFIEAINNDRELPAAASPSYQTFTINPFFASFFADQRVSESIRSILGLQAFYPPAKEETLRAKAAKFLGVSENASEKEIINRINRLRAQKVIRQSGFWTNIARAYATLTGKSFNLFEIQEKPTVSLTYDLPHHADTILHVKLVSVRNKLEELNNLLAELY